MERNTMGSSSHARRRMLELITAEKYTAATTTSKVKSDLNTILTRVQSGDIPAHLKLPKAILWAVRGILLLFAEAGPVRWRPNIRLATSIIDLILAMMP